MIGSTVSHYRILERLGGGGMGVVYKAQDTRLERLVALKFLSAQRSVSDDDKRRFLREAQSASALDHPHICTIYGIEETPEGDLFIAMAYCTGPSLRVRLERGPLPPAEALDIARQVARGLSAAHERGIVHRDVKPANLMFAGSGTIKIVDFGIAQVVDQTRLTRAGSAMGTAAYMAPEQLRGGTVDASADLWSLGVVLYEMLTGSPPWKGGSEKSLVHSILSQPPPALSPLVTGLAGDLDRIFAKLLARRPADRYASAGALLQALEPLHGESVSRMLDITLLELPAPVHLTPRPIPVQQQEAPREGDTELLWTPSSATRPSGGLASGSGAAAPALTNYRVLERIGQGGMGVVYRAVDAKLLRTVALKFLPPDLTRDPEAKERFLKEARAASALDHPNICTIHEVGETDDGQLFLSMACYDGETLQKRIERGPLPIEEAVEVAKQVAAGLAKAHRLGIVHRDVKPANLMATDDGVVKVLDFGIAKLAGVAALAGGSSAGTPSYMSPQQAAGEEVGPESDVWSLGAVLYEMLTGRRPFRGDTPQAIRYALDNEEPVPVRSLRPETPPELARIVARMLAKRPEERYRSLDEVLADLRAAFGPISGATETYTAVAPAARPRRSPLVWAFGALAVVALVAVTYLLFRERGPAAAAFHARRLTSLEGRETFPSLSPDGNYFVYAKTVDGNTNIFQQRVDGGKTLDLTADSAAIDTQPVYSPDGSRIAFRSERDGGGVFLMSASGESVRRISDFGFNPAWSHDGKELVVATEGVDGPDTRTTDSELWRIDVTTGAKRKIASSDAVQPSWSPNGLRIAYWGLPKGSAQRVIWTVPAEGGAPVRVTNDAHLDWNPVWSADGRYLYFASDKSGSMNLWRVPIDERSGVVRGDPEPINAPSAWSGLISLSADGRKILYATNDGKSNLERAPFDPARGEVAGPRVPVTEGSRFVRSCDPSPDGTMLACDSFAPQEDLFLLRQNGHSTSQLTDDPYKDRIPHWTADGRQITFYSNRSGRYEAWSIRPDGSAPVQLTRTGGESVTYPLPAPNRNALAVTVGARGAALLDLDPPLAQRQPRFLRSPGEAQVFEQVSWSPDGVRLAGLLSTGNDTASPLLTLYNLTTQAYEPLDRHGSFITWLHDSRRLLSLEHGALVLCDRTHPADGREILAPPPNSTFTHVSVTRDDRTLYLVRGTDEGDIWMLSEK